MRNGMVRAIAYLSAVVVCLPLASTHALAWGAGGGGFPGVPQSYSDDHHNHNHSHSQFPGSGHHDSYGQFPGHCQGCDGQYTGQGQANQGQFPGHGY
jgi:hypothetical protein